MVGSPIHFLASYLQVENYDLAYVGCTLGAILK